MRVFKLGRGQRHFWTRFTGLGTGKGKWQMRDVLVVEGFLRWLMADGPTDKLTDAELRARSEDGRCCELKGCTITQQVQQIDLPAEVASLLGTTDMKFFIVEVTAPGEVMPISFGFVDKSMIENLKDQIAYGISTFSNTPAMQSMYPAP